MVWRRTHVRWWGGDTCPSQPDHWISWFLYLVFLLLRDVLIDYIEILANHCFYFECLCHLILMYLLVYFCGLVTWHSRLRDLSGRLWFLGPRGRKRDWFLQIKGMHHHAWLTGWLTLSLARNALFSFLLFIPHVSFCVVVVSSDLFLFSLLVPWLLLTPPNIFILVNLLHIWKLDFCPPPFISSYLSPLPLWTWCLNCLS